MNKFKITLFVSIIIITSLFSWGIIIISNQVEENAAIYNEKYRGVDSLRVNNQERAKTKESVNILLIGLDEGGLRSDVIMIMNYEPESGDIRLMSIPRDSMVRYKGSVGKINALFAYGKEELLRRTLEEFTGLNIDYYITADFTGFRKVIDALGGVYLNVPIDMDYDDPQQGLSIHLKKGYQLLDGINAERFVRYRKSSIEGGKEIGDLGRIQMQEYLIKELFRQKLNIKYLSKADDIFILFKKYIKTNMNLKEADRFLANAHKITVDNIKSYIVPGQPSLIDDIWYYMVDANKTDQIIKSNFAT